MAVAEIWRQARPMPDKLAVVHDGLPVGYAHFARWIDGTRRYISAQGVPAGSVAVICVESLLESWVLLFALRTLGLTTIAVRRGAQLRTVPLRDVGVVVTSAAHPPPDVDLLGAALGRRVLRVPVELRAEAATGDLPDVPAMPVNGCGHILLTSGTTGDSKKVFRPAAEEALGIPSRAATHGISEASIVYVSGFGLWTAGGYRWSLMTWTVGGTVVLHQQSDTHEPLFRHSMTHIFATPATLYSLLLASKGHVRRNDATRLLVTGGTMPKALLDGRPPGTHQAGFVDARLDRSVARGDHAHRAGGRPAVASHRSLPRSPGGRRRGPRARSRAGRRSEHPPERRSRGLPRRRRRDGRVLSRRLLPSRRYRHVRSGRQAVAARPRFRRRQRARSQGRHGSDRAGRAGSTRYVVRQLVPDCAAGFRAERHEFAAVSVRVCLLAAGLLPRGALARRMQFTRRMEHRDR